jgi:hypothetical protein
MKLNRLAIGSITAVLAFVSIAAWSADEPQTARAQTPPPGCQGEFQQGVFARCIVIIKETDPSGSDESFLFEVDITGESTDEFELEDGEARGYNLGGLDVDVGDIVSINEFVPEGWTLTVSCDWSGFVPIDLEGDFIQFEYFGEGQPFDFLECTFLNVDDDPDEGDEGDEDEDEDDESDEDQDEADEAPRFIGGGIFLGIDTAQRNRARVAAAAATTVPAPTIRAPSTGQGIVPPSTGDGGLLP